MVAATLPRRGSRLGTNGARGARSEPRRVGGAYGMVTMSPTLLIELDRASSDPLYRQVEANVRRAIDDGRLRPGQRLPSVRGLAGQLGVGRLTIATAYE